MTDLVYCWSSQQEQLALAVDCRVFMSADIDPFAYSGRLDAVVFALSRCRSVRIGASPKKKKIKIKNGRVSLSVSVSILARFYLHWSYWTVCRRPVDSCWLMNPPRLGLGSSIPEIVRRPTRSIFILGTTCAIITPNPIWCSFVFLYFFSLCHTFICMLFTGCFHRSLNSSPVVVPSCRISSRTNGRYPLIFSFVTFYFYFQFFILFNTDTPPLRERLPCPARLGFDRRSDAIVRWDHAHLFRWTGRGWPRVNGVSCGDNTSIPTRQ